MSCLFCAISTGHLAAHVVFEDDVACAFLDKSPLFLGHVLVVPKTHVVALWELPAAQVGPFFERVQLIAEALPRALGAQGVFVANNNLVSQSVAHLHVHLIPRTKGDGLKGFFWPRQKYASEEDMAATAQAIGSALRRAVPLRTRGFLRTSNEIPGAPRNLASLLSPPPSPPASFARPRHDRSAARDRVWGRRAWRHPGVRPRYRRACWTVCGRHGRLCGRGGRGGWGSATEQRSSRSVNFAGVLPSNGC